MKPHLRAFLAFLFLVAVSGRFGESFANDAAGISKFDDTCFQCQNYEFGWHYDEGSSWYKGVPHGGNWLAPGSCQDAHTSWPPCGGGGGGGESEEVLTPGQVEVLRGAIAATDVNTVADFLKLRKVSYNRSRQAIQVAGCTDDAIFVSFGVSDVLATALAEARLDKE